MSRNGAADRAAATRERRRLWAEKLGAPEPGTRLRRWTPVDEEVTLEWWDNRRAVAKVSCSRRLTYDLGPAVLERIP